MKTSIRQLTIGTATLAAVIMSVCPTAQAQFVPGGLVVDRVGTGTGALSSVATQAFLDEYTTSAGQTAPIYTLTLTGLTNSGSATSEGLLSRSADGTTLLVPGYNSAVGTTGVASTSTTGTTNARQVATVGASGTFSLTTLGTAFSGNNIRGATSPDGSSLYAAGANGGIYNATVGSNTPSGSAPTLVSSTSTSNRAINIFGGSLYFSTGSGTQGIYTLGSATAPSSTATNILAVSNAYGFSISSDGLTAYVAGNSTSTNGFLTKFTRTDTSMSFTATAETLTAGINGVTGIVVNYGAGGAATIYGVTPTTLFSVTDSGAALGNLSTLATAANNTAFRGLDFAPVPEPATIFGGLLLVGALGWNQRRRLGELAGFLRSARAV